MQTYIAIDDTDNIESKGTGFRARELAMLLQDHGFAIPISVTRHQLFVHEKIPFTSHNSSASITVSRIVPIEKIIDFCADYLLSNAAEGSDAGLCVADFNTVNDEIINWGQRAKKEILTKENALKLAGKTGIFLKGYTGEKIGVIGSLAAVGLRKYGNDGRVLWLTGLRETMGKQKVSSLFEKMPVDRIETKEGIEIPSEEMINMGEWCRPVIINKKITIIAEEDNNYDNCKWKVASKEYIKSISE